MLFRSENGGVAFLFIYLTFVFFIGVPLMITEVAVGRGGQGDAISAFETGGNGKASVIHNMAAITVTANAPAIPAP